MYTPFGKETINSDKSLQPGPGSSIEEMGGESTITYNDRLVLQRYAAGKFNSYSAKDLYTLTPSPVFLLIDSCMDKTSALEVYSPEPSIMPEFYVFQSPIRIKTDSGPIDIKVLPLGGFREVTTSLKVQQFTLILDHDYRRRVSEDSGLVYTDKLFDPLLIRNKSLDPGYEIALHQKLIEKAFQVVDSMTQPISVTVGASGFHGQHFEKHMELLPKTLAEIACLTGQNITWKTSLKNECLYVPLRIAKIISDGKAGPRPQTLVTPGYLDDLTIGKYRLDDRNNPLTTSLIVDCTRQVVIDRALPLLNDFQNLATQGARGQHTNIARMFFETWVAAAEQ